MLDALSPAARGPIVGTGGLPLNKLNLTHSVSFVDVELCFHDPGPPRRPGCLCDLTIHWIVIPTLPCLDQWAVAFVTSS